MRDCERKWTSAYLVITEQKIAYFLMEYNGRIQSRLDNNSFFFFVHLI